MSLQENHRFGEMLVPKGRKDSDSLFSAASAAALPGPPALLLVGGWGCRLMSSSAVQPCLPSLKFLGPSEDLGPRISTHQMPAPLLPSREFFLITLLLLSWARERWGQDRATGSLAAFRDQVKSSEDKLHRDWGGDCKLVTSSGWKYIALENCFGVLFIY